MPIKAAFVLILMSSVALAKPAAPAPSEVDSILAKYRQAKSIQADVKKTVTQEATGTNESEGRFYFSKGRLRLEIEKPEKSVLVYDGKTIWLESRFDEKTVEVSKMKAGELKKTDSLLAALFDRKDALKGFKQIKATDGPKGEKVYAFEPKDKAKTDVQYLEVGIADKEISHIMYKDQMENQVTFRFSNLSKGGVAPEKFAYKPPKGANVTEM